MTSITTLPFEMISIIVLLLDLPDLLSLCQVSKNFQLWVQPCLFREFQASVNPDNTLTRLQSFGIALKHRPELYRAIRTIDVVGPYEATPNTAKVAHLLHPILNEVSNLRNLAFPADNHSFEILKLSSRLNIRKVRFDDSWLDYESVRKFLTSCPHLQMFEYIRPSSRVAASWEAASWEPLGWAHFNPAQITQALYPCRDSLQLLALSIPYEDDYLAYDANTDADPNRYLGPLTSFTCLKELWVDQYSLSSEVALPRSLEALRIHLLGPLRLDLLSHLALVSHALSSLRSICFLYDHEDPFEEFLPHYFDFTKAGFHNRVVIHCESDWMIHYNRLFSRICKQNSLW